MNIFKAISSASIVFEQGKAVKFSTVVTNTEAGGAMLYGFLSAMVTLLNSLGIEVNAGGTDLHTIANGWSATAGIIYGIYRIATNPASGVKAK